MLTSIGHARIALPTDFRQTKEHFGLRVRSPRGEKSSTSRFFAAEHGLDDGRGGEVLEIETFSAIFFKRNDDRLTAPAPTPLIHGGDEG